MIPFLSAIAPPPLTSVQRNAIPSGRRPPGSIIYNTDFGYHEQNVGTDSSPVWIRLAGHSTGELVFWPYAYSQAPVGLERCDGTSLSMIAQPRLNSLASASGYPHGSATGVFNKPDYRGRVPLGLDDMGTGAAGRVTSGSLNGGQAATLGGTGGEQIHSLSQGEVAFFALGYSDPQHSHPLNWRQSGTGNGNDVPSGNSVDSVQGTVSTQNAASRITINGFGGGGAHNNMPPWATCHILIAL